jgi:hypothetical protein
LATTPFQALDELAKAAPPSRCTSAATASPLMAEVTMRGILVFLHLWDGVHVALGSVEHQQANQRLLSK